MKITCSREALNRAISTVGRAIGGKSTMPIASHVAFTAHEGKLSLTGTNLENWIECTMPAEIGLEIGTFALPYDRLSELVTAFGGDTVSISVDETTHKVSLSCGRANSQIAGMDAESYPWVPNVTQEGSFRISGTNLIGAMRHVVFAVGTDNSRPILCGINIAINGATAKFAATDTNRVAIRTVPVEAAKGTVSVTIPVKPLSEAVRLCDTASEVLVSISPDMARFEIKKDANDKTPIVVTSRIIQGQYPNYDRIIPTSHSRRIVVEVDALAAAVKRIAVFSKDDAQRITLETKGHTLGLFAESNVAGKINDEVEIAMEGDDIRFALNTLHLQSFLSSVGSGSIALEWTEPLRPGIARPVGADGKDYLYVMSPITLPGK